MDLIVPPLEEEPFPTLGDQVGAFLEERACRGPGSLKGERLVLSEDEWLLLYRAYEVWPKGHRRAGRRRFERVVWSIRKGASKTEDMALITFAELHPESPVRFNGFNRDGSLKQGRPVRDPYIPLLANTKDQVEKLAYGALMVICEQGRDSELFDIALERIIRVGPDGRADGEAVPVANAPNAADGGRTTFQGYDEPLALDTIVPTARGWSTIGQLEAGDEVYDRNGHAVAVLGTSPVHDSRECYRVTFRDGSSVVTDANHRWKAVDWSNRPRGERVVTTKQMFTRGTDTRYGKRWRLPRAAGFDGVETDLPINPYLAGMWLGDGATNAGYIHSHVNDYKQIVGDYVHTVAAPVAGRESVIRWLPTGLRAKLRLAGMLGNKHIPDVYRFASRQQRLQMLAGLVDSDGYVIPGTGSVTFVQGKELLSRDVYELVRSLGWDASITSRPDPRSRTGLMWKVTFFAADKLPCRLERKKFGGKHNINHVWPAITSIEPCDSVPVRCIKVDNNDSLFVIGRECWLTHNTHRLYLPNHKAAIQTMESNLGKRFEEDPWSLGTTTAGEPGQDSQAEDDHFEAEAIARGEVARPSLCYIHRQASDGWDMDKFEDRIEAIREASGPELAARSDLEALAARWDRPRADRNYLERVWTNRWTQQSAQAFDVKRWDALYVPNLVIPLRALVTIGFDGARMRDSTGFVVTDVKTGLQQEEGLWERGHNEPEGWEVDELEVNEKRKELFKRFRVVKMFADPPHWNYTVGAWAAHHPDVVEEFWTNQKRRMFKALEAYCDAIESGAVKHSSSPGDKNNPAVGHLTRHIHNAGKRSTNLVADEQTGQKVWILCKIHPDRKFDLGMAGVLSWQARMDVLGTLPKGRRRIQRIR